jgi:ubiquinone/menaquinone biosynthesis C-methylase UbiE
MKKAVRSHYDTVAEEYVNVNQGIERVLSRIKLTPQTSVLDIGCGTGNLTFRLSELGECKRIVGVDISESV